jgi:DNA primase
LLPPSNERKASLEARQLRYDQQRPNLRPYLAGRGLGPDTADRFRLGLVPAGDDDPRRYHGRLAIPYNTPSGIVQIRYRCLDPHHGQGEQDRGCPKFLGDPGEKVTLYNAHATLRPSPICFLVEGEPDVWAVETLTGLPAVGVPGAKAWEAHPYWARCFVGFDRLILPADGDDAGEHLASVVRKALPELEIVRLPDGDDANSVLARDVAEFRARCKLDA